MNAAYLLIVVACGVLRTDGPARKPEKACQASLPGIVEPIRTADLSVMHDGVVASVVVEEGEKVEKGQLLLHLRDEVVASLVKAKEVATNLEAESAIAKAELRLARNEYDRASKIRKLSAASQVEVERAKTKAIVAEANVAQIKRDIQQKKCELQLEQARLQAHRLTAPFQGTIVRVNCEMGQAAKHGEPVMRLVDLRALRVSLHLPWAWRQHVQRGMMVNLTSTDFKADRIQAKVLTTDQILDPASKTFRCVLRIENSDLSLPSGFSVGLSKQNLLTASQLSRKNKLKQDGGRDAEITRKPE